MKKTLLVLASALFGMSVGLSVYAADQAPAAAAPAAQAKTLGQDRKSTRLNSSH